MASAVYGYGWVTPSLESGDRVAKPPPVIIDDGWKMSYLLSIDNGEPE
jgi:hypothetical protein